MPIGLGLRTLTARKANAVREVGRARAVEKANEEKGRAFLQRLSEVFAPRKTLMPVRVSAKALVNSA